MNLLKFFGGKDLDYEEMTKEELVKELRRLNRDKKYGLLWETKPERVDELMQDHYPVLSNIPNWDLISGAEVVNLLIEGDNLHALYLLHCTHEKSIDCMLIDPPYNTGNKDFIYNDKYVDKDDEWRHSKWISFMFRRLEIAKTLLKDDGVIFIHIDENEFAQLKLLCDQVFGEDNIVGTFIWKARSGKGGTNSKIATEHEYVYCYAKDINNVNFKSIINVGKGRKEQLRQWGQEVLREDREYMFFPILYNEEEDISKTIPNEEYVQIYNEETKEFNDTYLKQLQDKYEAEGYQFILPMLPDTSYGRWRVGYDTLKQLLQDKKIIFERDGDTYKPYRIYPEGDITETAIGSLLLDNGTASTGTKELKAIFGEKVFDTTKPLGITKHLIDLAMFNKENGVVMDFFAGSGTTGEAVLEYNKEKKRNIQFILCTNNEMKDKTRKKLLRQGITEDSDEYKAHGVCRKVTYPKLKAVIQGYQCDTDTKTIIAEKKLTITILKKMNSVLEKFEEVKQAHLHEYNDFELKIQNNKIYLLGVTKANQKVPGIKADIKYYITDVIHKNKNKDQMAAILAQKIYDLLCIKENCFNLVLEKPYYRIYQQGDKLIGIYTYAMNSSIDEFKEVLRSIKSRNKIIYSFSFTNVVNEDVYADIDGAIVKAIPSKILEMLDDLNRRRV